MYRNLKIKLFADGADVNEMKDAYRKGIVKGFTTNPTLMKKAGVTDYMCFAKAVLAEIRDLPISFEVFSDDFESMEREAREIASWGENVYVKIPITNTKGASSIPLVRKLSADGLQLNVTAILTVDQVRSVKNALSPAAPAIVSVFAGRVADTGRDPMPIMEECAALLAGNPSVELLWASSRELLNVFQAEKVGCHIITITNDILKKLSLVDKDLSELSLDTVKMFYNDAKQAGFTI
ncbi:MAG: transaldolase [Syntrophobacteraceae bacterium]|jgi:transaldolase